jgi:pyruvate dehydrogenase E2 component (dihydrolipoamide acetyltransferase)
MSIEPIVMPKWGLAMQEGTLSKWNIAEGDKIARGQEIADIETTKIANAFESPVEGVVRRRVINEGDVVPVGALLAVVADKGVGDAEIDAYVTKFQESMAAAASNTVAAPQPQVVETAAGRIRYLKLGEGDGTPVVLIHGFGSDHAAWLFNHEALAEGRVVYALDLPGHGGSEKAVKDGSVAGLATAVVAFLDAVEVKKAHLVGHSLGGAIIAHIAATHPDRVASLSLVAPAGIAGTINQGFIDGFLQESRARKLRPVIELLVADPSMVTADMVEDVLKFKRLDGATEALTAIAAANFSGGKQSASLRDALAGAKVPVQVIVGESDQILPASGADGLPASVTVHRLAAVGHLPHMEKSAEVNRLVAAILRD